MLGAAYRWIGLGVGTICALLAVSALIQELRGPIDFGNVAFDVIFGLFTGGIAATCGVDLLRDRRKEVGGGCLVIVLVTGAMILLTGAVLLALSIDSVEPPPPLMVGVLIGLGLVLVIPSSVVLLRRASHRQ
jgi:hypothetical protein